MKQRLIVILIITILLVSGCVGNGPGSETELKIVPEEEVFVENETIVINFPNLLSVFKDKTDYYNSNPEFSLYRINRKKTELDLVGCIRCAFCDNGELRFAYKKLLFPADSIPLHKKVKFSWHFTQEEKDCNGIKYNETIPQSFLDGDYKAEFCYTKKGKSVCADSKVVVAEPPCPEEIATFEYKGCFVNYTWILLSEGCWPCGGILPCVGGFDHNKRLDILNCLCDSGKISEAQNFTREKFDYLDLNESQISSICDNRPKPLQYE